MCWALLDYSSAVVEGVVQGAVAAAHTFMHPIETINNVVGAIKTVGYHTAVFLLQVAEINQAIDMHDCGTAQTQMIDLSNRIENNIQFLCDAVKETSGRELVCGAAAFATEGYLTGKATHACSKLFAQAKITIVPALEKIKDTAQKYYKDFNVIPSQKFKYALSCEASEYTKKDKPWELVVCMAFRDIDCAKNFEKYLKSQSGRAFSKKRFW